MHIPDGYLSPKTCGVFYAVMAPVWYIAARRVESTLKNRQLPLLALGAAFTFVIMMFNIPIPGGAAGHMVGGVVVAIVLGPWAGVVAMTLSLTLQAVFFGDGGITTLGANSFNMAFLMSFSGYYIYRALASGEEVSSARRLIASALAGYLAVNIAALAVALELGVQPLIARGHDGNPLYSPYNFSVTVPAMMIPHLVFFGMVEGIGTAVIVSYVYRTNEELLYRPGGRGLKTLWIVIIVMIILTPLGLLVTGTPWGEWGAGEFTSLIGYIPEGMERLSGTWRGIMPDYAVPGVGGRLGSSAAYVLSALMGSIAVVTAIYIWGKKAKRG